MKKKMRLKNPIMYINSLLNKSNILRENKNKSGIYKWTLSKDNKSYIGSSSNISKRLRKYYCPKYLNNKIIKYNSRIYRALLKHGYSNFNLEILEYCNKESLINREQYYIDTLKPEYNICKIAGSMLGFKHSEKTLLKFKNRDTGTGHVTIVINMDNKQKKAYNSLRAAARSLGVSHTTLRRYLNKKKLLKGIYYIKPKDN
jgi:GIY-YIG catalytic domain/NUMOD1 domain